MPSCHDGEPWIGSGLHANASPRITPPPAHPLLRYQPGPDGSPGSFRPGPSLRGGGGSPLVGERALPLQKHYCIRRRFDGCDAPWVRWGAAAAAAAASNAASGHVSLPLVHVGAGGGLILNSLLGTSNSHLVSLTDLIGRVHFLDAPHPPNDLTASFSHIL